MAKFKLAEHAAREDFIGLHRSWEVVDESGVGFYVDWVRFSEGALQRRRSECMAFPYDSGRGKVLSWRESAAAYDMEAEEALREVIAQLGIEVEP